ncbi:MAG: Holliday junction resolvase RuvX [Gammaproteobacteria bacterium]|nr:Holliday junction resolvase RuvX [Gammaproteobacteria bacterium]
MTGRSKTLLGFDYGEKHIGVAVGQTLTATASPLETVQVKNRQPDWDTISRLIETWKPDALIVGLPLNMDGTPQAMTRAAERFMRQLQGRYPLPVQPVDERLSTIEAVDRSKSARQTVDAIAAQVILETWLALNRDKRKLDDNRNGEASVGKGDR